MNQLKCVTCQKHLTEMDKKWSEEAKKQHIETGNPPYFMTNHICECGEELMIFAHHSYDMETEQAIFLYLEAIAEEEETLPEFTEVSCPNCGEAVDCQVRGAVDDFQYLGEGVSEISVVSDCPFCDEQFQVSGKISEYMDDLDAYI